MVDFHRPGHDSTQLNAYMFTCWYNICIHVYIYT